MYQMIKPDKDLTYLMKLTKVCKNMKKQLKMVYLMMASNY